MVPEGTEIVPNVTGSELEFYFARTGIGGRHSSRWFRKVAYTEGWLISNSLTPKLKLKVAIGFIVWIVKGQDGFNCDFVSRIQSACFEWFVADHLHCDPSKVVLGKEKILEGLSEIILHRGLDGIVGLVPQFSPGNPLISNVSSGIVALTRAKSSAEKDGIRAWSSRSSIACEIPSLLRSWYFATWVVCAKALVPSHKHESKTRSMLFILYCCCVLVEPPKAMMLLYLNYLQEALPHFLLCLLYSEGGFVAKSFSS